jgi:hypothetical protein
MATEPNKLPADYARPCAYCHGVRLAGSTAFIHATRFEPGAHEGSQIRYDFCDGGCKKLWLDRGETAASALCQVEGHVWVDPGRCSRCGLWSLAHNDGGDGDG